jgi:hypothetical protein
VFDISKINYILQADGLMVSIKTVNLEVLSELLLAGKLK